jgi:hypothetical protein
MSNRPSDALAFLTILAVCLAGALHQPWWAALAGAGALVIISLLKAWNGSAQRVATARKVRDPIQFAASSLNGTAIAGAAFGFGQFTTWAWGI